MKTKDLQAYTGYKLQKRILNGMSSQKLTEYEKLTMEAKADIIRYMPAIVSVFLLVYSVSVNYNYAQILGFGWQISVIFMLMDVAKTYAAMIVAIQVQNKEKIDLMALSAMVIFTGMAIYAFTIVNQGNANKAAVDGTQYERELQAYELQIKTLTASISDSRGMKPSKDEVLAAEANVLYYQNKMDKIVNRTTWKNGKRIIIGSMLGSPICAKINGKFTRRYCPSYVTARDNKESSKTKLDHLRSYESPDAQVKTLNALLAQPPKSPKSAIVVLLPFVVVIVFGFLIEFLGIIFILFIPKSKNDIRVTRIAKNDLRKFVAVAIKSYLMKNERFEDNKDNKGTFGAFSNSIGTNENNIVNLSAEAKIVARAIIRAKRYEVLNTGVLNQILLKCLLNDRAIKKLIKVHIKENNLITSLEFAINAKYLKAIMAKFNVTSKRNRGWGITASFKSSLLKLAKN